MRIDAVYLPQNENGELVISEFADYLAKNRDDIIQAAVEHK